MSEKKAQKTVATMTGVALGDATGKTVTVTVDTYKTHPKYQKRYRSTKKYHVHDPENHTKRGDVVQFVQCKPLSKKKSYHITTS